ncbi:MAG: hypothetical protein JW724_06210 [Candidatus Altiarchaeota archaeon]|nr:hypothetical protein [Candidatus Altiarchaeota archaeon]
MEPMDLASRRQPLQALFERSLKLRKRQTGSILDEFSVKALETLRKMFDFPCGQRPRLLIETELNRLLRLREVLVLAETAAMGTFLASELSGLGLPG